MAAGDISLNILIGATDKASGVIAGLAGSGALGSVAVAALGAGTALVGFGVASVSAAANFQQGMTTLVTGAGESQSALALVSQGILNLSTATGTSTQQLTTGMFEIESAGYRGAAGLSVLQAAAQGAKVGNADLGDTTNAVLAVMKDYGLGANQAGDAMNFLTAIVQNGITNLSQLAPTMSQVLPAASAVGVHLTDVGAAMATMTGETVPAANAATYLRQMIISLAAPASAGAKSLAAIGLTTQQVSDSMKVSLPNTLQMIMTHLADTYTVGSPQYVAALKNIAGGSKQMQGMLDLTGTHLKDFQANMANVANTMNQGKGQVLGWTAVQGDFNTQMDRAKASVAALFIVIGTQLLPILTPMVSAITNAIGSFTQWVSTGNNLKSLMPFIIGGVAGLATIVLVAVVPAFLTWAAATIAATWPILLIAVAVAALVAGVILAYTNFTPFRVAVQAAGAALGGLANFFTQTQVGAAILKATLIVLAIVIGAIGIVILATVIPAFIAWVAGAIAVGIANIIAFWPIILIILAIVAVITIVILIIQNWGAIVGWLGGVWNAIMGAITAAWNAVVAFLSSGLQQTESAFQSVWNGIMGFLQGVWNFILGIIQAAIQTVVGWFSWLYDHNYYFKELVDFITKVISGVVAFLTGIWKTVVGWIAAQWNLLHGMAMYYWNLINYIIQQKLAEIHAFITAVITAVVSFFSDKWNAIVGFTSSLWKTISGFFSNAWSTYIAGPLGGLWNSISGWFGNLTKNALTWGQNLIQGFINGIEGMIGNVGKAVGDVMGKIGGLLGFHSPTKEGEGRYIIEWGQNMVKSFAQGITQATPMLHAQVSHLIQAPNFSSSVKAGSAFALSSPVVHVQIAPAETKIHLDKREVGHAVMNFAAKEIRTQGGVRSQ